MLNDIDTIVIVIMENRSFDHVLGYLASASAAPSMPVEGVQDDPGWQSQWTNLYRGISYPLHPLAQTFRRSMIHRMKRKQLTSRSIRQPILARPGGWAALSIAMPCGKIRRGTFL